MDAWQTSVENRLDSLDRRMERRRSDMETNFRWTWSGLVAVFVALLGALAGGFLHLSAKIDTAVVALIERTAVQ